MVEGKRQVKAKNSLKNRLRALGRWRQEEEEDQKFKAT